MKKTSSLIEDKKRQGAEGLHSLELQKAHPTSEFVIVAQNGGCVLLSLASSLATVVSE